MPLENIPFDKNYEDVSYNVESLYANVPVPARFNRLYFMSNLS